VGDAARRVRVPDNCFADLGLHVVNGEDLEGREADGQRGELTDDLSSWASSQPISGVLG
jgi:hypothetical protein